MSSYPNSTDPYELDVLSYLSPLNGDLSPVRQREHYEAIRLALTRTQYEDPATYDLAVKEISKKLGIKAKTVRTDIQSLQLPPPAKEALDLLDKMGQTRVLRLAQDFVAGRQWFGIIAGEDKLLLNSDRRLLTLDEVDDLTVRDQGFDLCRISKEAVHRYLRGDAPHGYELLADLRAFFTRFAIFKDARVPLLLATWTLATYCYRVFRIFPYLVLHSPEKRCGKSRVLDLLSLLAFNASSKTVHPTEAQLFRSPGRNGGTLLLDEVEALGKADKDAYAGLLSILNSGFEQNGTVERQVKDAVGNYQGMNFETFCPRALAGIKKTTDTLEDRSIIIAMQRKLKKERTERFSPGRLQAEAQALRDGSYLWALSHAADVAEMYEAADKRFDLDTLDDRARDLWEPLISLAAVADNERQNAQTPFTDELTLLARDLGQLRDAGAEDSDTSSVVAALSQITEEKQKSDLLRADNTLQLTPTELAGLLKEKLGWEKLSTKGLAALLNPLDLYAKQTWGEKRGRKYHLAKETLDELANRYA